jgi:TetR/AcrR family transcriptional regulator, transcriptional repressor for nem operon
MKVTKAQAQENRARIVATASILFRERGYDGVGVADLMEAAGFTHGGFYKHFRSKADLMAEAAACGLSQTMTEAGRIDAADFVRRYVCRAHRDARGGGCTLAALSGDAARQPAEIKAEFAAGIEGFLAAGEAESITRRSDDPRKTRAKMIALLAHSVGALVLSRACPDDSPLADEILEACRTELLATPSPELATSESKPSASGSPKAR